MTNEDKDYFVIYEYTSLEVKKILESLYIDSYQYLGWDLEGSFPTYSKNTVILKFKRDRKIRNYPSMLDLQEKGDLALGAISQMEDRQHLTAVKTAIGTGAIGILFFIISILGFSAGKTSSAILLTFLGLAGCGLSYLSYLNTLKKTITKMDPLFDRQLEILYGVCEQAKYLLSRPGSDNTRMLQLCASRI